MLVWLDLKGRNGGGIREWWWWLFDASEFRTRDAFVWHSC